MYIVKIVRNINTIYVNYQKLNILISSVDYTHEWLNFPYIHAVSRS